MAPKSIKKALGFSLKDTGHSALSENLIKPVENEDFWEATSPPSELQPAGLRAQPGPAGLLFFLEIKEIFARGGGG